MRFKLGQKIIDKIRGKNEVAKIKKIKSSNISSSVIFKTYGEISIDKTAEVKEGVVLQNGINDSIKIDKYTQINPYCILYGGNISIGKNVMIAPAVVITTADHDFEQTEKPMRFAGCINNGNVNISDDVWIGANCTITSGVTIGEGAVIGANSVVTKDIPPYAIAYGVPCKVQKYRKICGENS